MHCVSLSVSYSEIHGISEFKGLDVVCYVD